MIHQPETMIAKSDYKLRAHDMKLGKSSISKQSVSNFKSIKIKKIQRKIKFLDSQITACLGAKN